MRLYVKAALLAAKGVLHPIQACAGTDALAREG